MLRDIKHALRMFGQSPAFALAAVAALTLGIAVNTAIFSVVNAVLLRPLPFPDAERIVFFMSTGQGPDSRPRLRRSSRTSAADRGHRAGVGVQQRPDELHGRQLPRAAARRPRVGGLLPPVRRANDDGPHLHRGRGSSARRQGRRSSARRSGRRGSRAIRRFVGKAMSLGGMPHTVIGVLDDFKIDDLFNQPMQVWVPFQLDPDTSDQGHYFQSAGRLKDGVSLEQAQARLKTSAADFQARIQGRARAAKQLQRRANRRRAGS